MCGLFQYVSYMVLNMCFLCLQIRTVIKLPRCSAWKSHITLTHILSERLSVETTTSRPRSITHHTILLSSILVTEFIQSYYINTLSTWHPPSKYTTSKRHQDDSLFSARICLWPKSGPSVHHTAILWSFEPGSEMLTQIYVTPQLGPPDPGDAGAKSHSTSGNAGFKWKLCYHWLRR